MPRFVPRPRRILVPRRVLTLLLVGFSLASTAQASEIPPSLQPWVPWVLAGQTQTACARLGDQPVCAWPGRLALTLDEAGGRFSLSVHADAPLDLALPGDDTRWPRDLRVDGAPAVLGRSGDRPSVHLAPGAHTVVGAFLWSRLPESLLVPPSIGLVELTVRGAVVRSPRRDADGLLWLQAGAAEQAEEDRLSIEVHRRLDDGVPLTTSTRLRLRVSGRSREVDLGRPLLGGTVATALASSLPARLDAEGRLQVQLRPGDWEIRVDARSEGPVASLVPPDLPAPWPTEETWVFQSSPSARSVRVDGAPGVDPARTSLPDEWRSLPAWRVARGTTLTFVELRRGEAEPPPDRLTVTRRMWLALDGGGLAVEDRIEGSLFQGGRLEMAAPGVLGRASIGGQAQLITTGEGSRGGVEVRDAQITMEATGSWPVLGALPAVGWDRDAQTLQATLELPPGWRLLTALGVDDAPGSWLDQWTLMDLFLVLLVALAVGQLTSRRWGAMALVLLALSWQEDGVPKTGWIVLLATLGLLRVLPVGHFQRLISLVRWVVVIVVATQAVVFCWSASRNALFPQLERHASGALDGNSYGWDGGNQGGNQGFFKHAEMGGAAAPAAPSPSFEQQAQDAPAQEEGKPADGGGPSGEGVDWGVGGLRGRGDKSVGASDSSTSYLPTKRAARLDPQAVVQTGPGLPRWSWSSSPLVFNGPVSTDHEIRLILAGPLVNGLLGLLRLLGTAALLLLLADPRRTKTVVAMSSPSPVAASLLLGAVLGIGALGVASPRLALAQDLPDQALLDELQRRLLTRPACEPDCVQVAAMSVFAGPDGLRIEVEVHAAALAPLRLPGPDAAWVPARVELDGAPILALHRDAAGFLALRVPEGVHRVMLAGPARDEVGLQLPVVPKVLRFEGDGWTITGHRPDAPPPGSVQLSRARSLDETAGGEADANAELPPWLQVRRALDLGVPWLVHTELHRLGGGTRAVLVRVPLLPGESVTSSGIPVEGGEAVVALEPGETVRAWDSTLAETAALVLTAPADRPWTEVWTLDCAPIWSCKPSGLAPTRHLAEERWLPRWEPWAGESLRLELGRPEPAEGVTSTLDAVSLDLTSGRRMLEASLTLSLRSSQGGEHAVTLPPGATLRTFTVDGRDHPTQRDGQRLVFAVEPGGHSVVATWSSEATGGLLARAPAVDVGQDAANVLVTWTLPDHRWILWAWGPRWGPVVTVWQYLLVLVLVSVLLGRLAPTPLRIHDWFLLGLGLTQLPPALTVVLVLWLVGLSLRGGWTPPSWFAHFVVQASLLVMTCVALGVLYGAIYQGLVLEPDLGVQGGGSYGRTLKWFVDRSDGTLPQPGVLWLPVWCWRVAMLLWALWLASRLLRWLRWGWEQVGFGGLLTVPPFLRRTPLPSSMDSASSRGRAESDGDASGR